MVYSYITYSKQGRYYLLTFEDDTNPGEYLKLRILPYDAAMIFSPERIDLHSIRMRDPMMILSYIEAHALTLIVEGLQ